MTNDGQEQSASAFPKQMSPRQVRRRRTQTECTPTSSHSLYVCSFAFAVHFVFNPVDMVFEAALSNCECARARGDRVVETARVRSTRLGG